MIKDPFHNEETPYELLGIEPNVRQNQIQGALTRFMKDRRNIPRLGKAQEAIKKLKNLESRIAIDILFYSIEREHDDDFETQDLHYKLQSFIEVPHLDDNELYTDLQKGDFSDDFEKIKFHKVSFKELNKYDGLDSIKLAMKYDT